MGARANGFTLLETLVAVAVSALLLAGLAQGVHFGMLAARAAARTAATDGGLNEIDLTLRHLIEAVAPVTNRPEQPPLLAGPDSVTLLTNLPGDGEPSGEPHVVATLLVDARHRLILRWRKLADLDIGAPMPPPVETPLLNGVAHLGLAFWRPDAGWVSGWRSADPPAMIRIHLSFDAPARHWPDIVVAARLDQP